MKQYSQDVDKLCAQSIPEHFYLFIMHEIIVRRSTEKLHGSFCHWAIFQFLFSYNTPNLYYDWRLSFYSICTVLNVHYFYWSQCDLIFLFHLNLNTTFFFLYKRRQTVNLCMINFKLNLNDKMQSLFNQKFFLDCFLTHIYTFFFLLNKREKNFYSFYI